MDHTGSLGTTQLCLFSSKYLNQGAQLCFSQTRSTQIGSTWGLATGSSFLTPDLGKHAFASCAQYRGVAASTDCTEDVPSPPFMPEAAASLGSSRTGEVQPAASSLFSPLPHYHPAMMTFSDPLKSSFLPRGFNSLNFLQSSLHHPNLSTSYSTFKSQLECLVSKEASPSPST